MTEPNVQLSEEAEEEEKATNVSGCGDAAEGDGDYSRLHNEEPLQQPSSDRNQVKEDQEDQEVEDEELSKASNTSGTSFLAKLIIAF